MDIKGSLYVKYRSRVSLPGLCLLFTVGFLCLTSFSATSVFVILAFWFRLVCFLVWPFFTFWPRLCLLCLLINLLTYFRWFNTGEEFVKIMLVFYVENSLITSAVHELSWLAQVKVWSWKGFNRFVLIFTQLNLDLIPARYQVPFVPFSVLVASYSPVRH